MPNQINSLRVILCLPKKQCIHMLVCLTLLSTIASDANSEIVRGRLLGAVEAIEATGLSGIPDNSTFESFLPFSIGSPVVADFSYDTSTGEFLSKDEFDITEYRANGSLGITIDGNRFATSTINVEIQDEPENFALDSISIRYNSLQEGGLSASFPEGWSLDRDGNFLSGYLFIRMRDFSGTALESSDLPEGPFDERSFGSGAFGIKTSVIDGTRSLWTLPNGESYAGRSQMITGRFTSITFDDIAVPEPSTAAMALLATLSCCLRRIR